MGGQGVEVVVVVVVMLWEGWVTGSRADYIGSPHPFYSTFSFTVFQTVTQGQKKDGETEKRKRERAEGRKERGS